MGLSSLGYGQQIMPAAKIKLVEAHLPQVEPGIVKDVLEDPTGIWYDRESIGVAYQLGAGASHDLEFRATGRLGIANAMLNVTTDAPESQKPAGFGGNLNVLDNSSYPWNPVPGGTHRSPNVSSVKRFRLPKQPNGRPWPVVVHEAELEGLLRPTPTVTGLDWIFPIGTVFIEPITVNDDVEKQHYVCIIRSRLRTRDYWAVESMAPARTAQEMEALVKKLDPEWASHYEVVQFIRHLRDPSTAPGRLTDNTPGNRAFGTRRGDAFSVSAQVDKLPALPRELVSKILDTVVFKESAGYEWKLGCNAPTTDEEFHIVPKNYDGAFIPIDSTGCARCHSGAQISARRHSAVNQKYGWVRGNKEGILSWHPFDPKSLTREANPEVRLRQSWVDAGIVAYYDPQKHPASVYHPIK